MKKIINFKGKPLFILPGLRLPGLKNSMFRMSMVVMLLFGSTASYGQQDIKTFDINVKDASFQQVVDVVKKKTGLQFVYSLEKVSKIKAVNIQLKGATFEDVLKILLKDSNLTYTIKNGIVVIKEIAVKGALSNSQPLTVRGVVKDESGAPLLGVAVFVKGTSNGTNTAVNGAFELTNVPDKNSVMVFSFVGMKTTEIVLQGRTVVDVTLKEDATEIQDVVITGYQQVEKRKLSSSIVSLTAEELKEGAASSIDNMLQGKIAGMAVLGSTSTPGAATKIRIRGSSSIAGNREPVWVVDGVIITDPVPLSAAELNSLDRINLVGNAIASINPEDIERIDVLKDASATAIYGVKAANGVIVVTTKKGKIGEPRFNYSTNISVSQRPSYNKLNRMTSLERIDVSKEIYDRKLPYQFSPAPVAFEGELYKYMSKEITYDQFLQNVKTLEENNTDWFDILFRTAISHKHNLSVSGATNRINYYTSVGYNNTQGTVKGNDMKVYSVMSNLGFQASERLRIDVQIRASVNKKDYQYSGIDPFQYAYNTSRAIPCYNEDGSLTYYNKSQGHRTQLRYNILNELQNSSRSIENQYLTFGLNANYKLSNLFKVSGIFNYSKSNTYQSEWFNDQTYIAASYRNLNYGDPFPDSPAFYKNQCQLPYGGMLKNDDSRSNSYLGRLNLAYNQTVAGKHEFSAIAGTEINSNGYNGIMTREYGYMPQRGDKFVFIDPNIFKPYLELLKSNPNSVTDRITNMVSFYGSCSYDYDNRYIANFNIRTDGSNKFGQDRSTRFLPVWSVSGRWNVHNETFLSGVDNIDEFAIRASYGIQGNVSDDQSPYLIIQMGSTDPVSGHMISNLSKLPNPNLKWEKTKSYNLAADMSFLKGRLGGTVECYYKRGTDMIISKQVSLTTGSSSMELNAGTLINQGLDVTIEAIPVRTKNFSWVLSVNGAKNKNKVVESVVDNDYGFTDYIEGNAIVNNQSINIFYSYQYNGLDSQGYPTFKNIEESDGITKKQMYDQVFRYSGKRLPDVTGGVTMSFKYKNWGLNALFSYSLGSKIRLNNLYESQGQYLPQPQQNMDNIFVDRWHKPGDKTDIPVLSNNPLDITPSILNSRKINIGPNLWELYNKSDLRVASGDFLRLRNVTLTYEMKNSVCKHIGINSARFRFEASNLWTLCDKKLRGQDPEQIAFTYNTGAVPLTSVFNLGIDITF